MANQEKTRVKEQYFIPLEVKEGTIITKEFEDAPRTWSKIGNRRVRTILIPATKEQYEAYMRPEWKEDKRQQRLAEKRRKREKAQDRELAGVLLKISDTAERAARNLIMLRMKRNGKGVNFNERGNVGQSIR